MSHVEALSLAPNEAEQDDGRDQNIHAKERPYTIGKELLNKQFKIEPIGHYPRNEL